jgi:hypothetical protein
VTILSSHASDDTTKATWPRCNVDAKSCRWQCCQVILAMALPSHVGDGAVEVT